MRCNNITLPNTRREFLGNVAGGFTATALAGMLGSEGFFNKANAASPSAAK